jgi:hypothetical protein
VADVTRRSATGVLPSVLKQMVKILRCAFHFSSIAKELRLLHQRSPFPISVLTSHLSESEKRHSCGIVRTNVILQTIDFTIFTFTLMKLSLTGCNKVKRIGDFRFSRQRVIYLFIYSFSGLFNDVFSVNQTTYRRMKRL